MSRSLLPLLLLIIGCSRPPSPQPQTLAEKTDAAMLKGVVFLLRHQSKDDGTWRSDTYATFKDGTALTPLVLCALQDSAEFADSKAARQKASNWLAKLAKPKGTIDEGKDGLPYPAYTAALSINALSHPENQEHIKARAAWLKYLLARQLTEQHGWTPADKQYGGWGYYPLVPKKPAPGQAVPSQQLLESNLSATTFALDALHTAGIDDPRILGPAKRFVESCQNKDGGFHFIYDDPVRNKAGASDSDGQRIFHSYGSTTADGVRALLRAGLKRDSDRVMNAQSWCAVNFTADRHPGEYIPTHEPNRNAVYFYYAASVARTFRLLGVLQINGPRWADSLSRALLAKQRPDGSWANPVDLVRENDPVVATAYALTALAECRKAMPP